MKWLISSLLFQESSIKSRLGLPGAISVRDRLRYPRGFGARRGRIGLTGKSPLIRGLNRREYSYSRIWTMSLYFLLQIFSFVTVNAMDVDIGPPTRRARSPFVSNKLASRKCEVDQFVDSFTGCIICLLSCCFHPISERRSRSRSRSRPPPRSRSQSRNRSASISRYRGRSRSRSRSRFGSYSHASVETIFMLH